MFSKVIKEFHELYWSNQTRSSQDAEIYKRLAQLDWLIKRCKFLNETVMSDYTNPNFAILTELEIMTEAFYHFAWRLEEILKYHPDFNKLPSTKVGRVRNNLIQHPEKEGNKQKSFPSFTVGTHNGPQIKAYIGPDQSYMDDGLFVNAEDLIQKFAYILEQKRKI